MNGLTRQLRERKALSLRELAQVSGLSVSTLLRFEEGQGKPQPRTIRKVAQALGVDPEVLTSAQLRMPE